MASEATALADRIKAEFESRTRRRESDEQERARGAELREQRLAQFTRVCDDLRSIWRPRFEEFARQFGQTVKVTPTITPALREAKAVFATDLASVTLTLTASLSADATTLVLDYDLLIIPMYFDYERHARLETPLDRVDRNAVAQWIDDRLVVCVKTYLAMQDNEFYLKRAMVEDPVTKARFMRDEAAETLEHNGHTLYFSSADTLRQYKEKHQIKA